MASLHIHSGYYLFSLPLTPSLLPTHKHTLSLFLSFKIFLSLLLSPHFQGAVNRCYRHLHNLIRPLEIIHDLFCSKQFPKINVENL